MPSKPDTFAEVVKDLQAWAFAASKPDGSPTPNSEFLDKAARLLAAAGEEVRAVRALDKAIEDLPVDYHMTDRVDAARAALNALAPELQENDQ